MSIFHEIRFHGRGGQGTVSAAALMALAAFEDGFESQAFPKFGSERRGAPVEAYVRISRMIIRTHNSVYTPDAMVIQDAGLLRSEALLRGIKRGGLIVLNSEQNPADGDDDFRIKFWARVMTGVRSMRCVESTISYRGCRKSWQGWV